MVLESDDFGYVHLLLNACFYHVLSQETLAGGLYMGRVSMGVFARAFEMQRVSYDLVLLCAGW